MSTCDMDFKKATWDEAKAIVASGRINDFGRGPTQLRRYHEYCHRLKQEHGSVLHFLQHHRLKWPEIKLTGDDPWTQEADYRILYNDWPYALDDDIKHIVVWTKFPIGEEDEAGHLTAESYALIEDFVVRKFCMQDNHRSPGIPRENLVWFKNWKSLRSVNALEHFHILVYKASESFLREITHGDMPMSERLAL